MRNRRLVPVFISALIFVLMISSFPSYSQPAGNPISVRNVDGEAVETPVYQVRGTQTSSKAGKWFRTYFEYDTEEEWLNELTVTFYVMVKAKTRDVPPVSVFKGTTTYIHIPKGRGHIAEMFIHPNIIARFGEVDAIAVEARVGGRVVARTGKPKPSDAWWERFSPTEGVLLNPTQTPFAFINLDTQELIKPAN